jgi:hypothetical protein
LVHDSLKLIVEREVHKQTHIPVLSYKAIKTKKEDRAQAPTLQFQLAKYIGYLGKPIEL